MYIKKEGKTAKELFEMPVKCSMCGCEFDFDFNDINLNYIGFECFARVECPNCKVWNSSEKIKENGGCD